MAIWAHRFWPNATIGDGCWEWTGAVTSGGYGKYGNLSRSAHRVAWELARGPIPAGICVLHRCDNRRCIRPGHLFLGTHADNTADMVAKGRAATGDRHWTKFKPYWRSRATPPERVARGERQGNAKLTADDVRAIRSLYAAGENRRVISERFATPLSNVKRIAARKAWRHVE